MRYSKLNALVQRRIFNPADEADLLELKYFLENSKWKKGCPFYLEEYWENIPIMCKEKYAVYMLSQLKNNNKRKQKSPK